MKANLKHLTGCFDLAGLHRHQHSVCMVKWSPNDANLRLASVDTSGTIIIWNVLDGTPLTVILPTTETKTIGYLSWFCVDRKQEAETKTSSSPTHQSDDIKLPFAPAGSNIKDEAYNVQTSKTTTSTFLLAFYYSTNTFILYDTEHGDAITKWAVGYRITHISANPFCKFNRYCDGDPAGYHLLVGLQVASSQPSDRIFMALVRLNENDFSRDHSLKEPRKATFVFNVYSLHNSQTDKLGGGAGARVNGLDVITKISTPRLASLLATMGDANHSMTNNSNNLGESCIQLVHHRSVRNQIFIVFSRDIYLVDLSIETIISVIPIERNCSRIVKIFPCSQRNAFYVVHDTGNVSFRLYQKKMMHDRTSLKVGGVGGADSFVAGNSDDISLKNGASGPPDMSNATASFLNVGYINLCQSDPIRLTKKNRIYGYTMCSFNEARLAFLLSTGRLVVKSLISQKMSEAVPDRNVLTTVDQVINQTMSLPFLGDLIKPQEYQLGAFLVSEFGSGIGASVDQHQQPTKPFDSIEYKLLATDFFSTLNTAPTVVRMCPPLTMQNYSKHRPLLAVGDSLGLVQVWLLKDNSANLYREFSIHSYPVAGIEWTGLSSLISFSYPTISSPSHHPNHQHQHSSVTTALSIVTGSGSSSGKVTNELMHLDIETGKVTSFRTNRINDSSPIETIRVSHLKQYLIVLFKRDDPFEIWDVHTFQLLRVMPKSLNNITAVEWSPLYTKRKAAKNSEVSDSDSSQKAGSGRQPDRHIGYMPSKENFIVTNRNLFHYSIEGNILRELACIPPDSESGHVSVTSIAWKSDRVLLGDASGTINIWDLKSKVSMTESTFRTYIRKIRFGPGRGNMKCLVLYADFGVDIFDIGANFRVVAQLKYPRDTSYKIIDIDWATWEHPILCTAEGFIFISDLRLKTFSSAMSLQSVQQTPTLKVDQQQLFQHLNETSAVHLVSFTANANYNVFRMDFEAQKQFYAHFLFHLPEKVATAQPSQESGDDGLATSDGELDDDKDEVGQHIDLKRYIEQQMLLAKLFSNASDFDFWTIVGSILRGDELDSRLDLFLNSADFRHLQQERLLLLETNRKTYAHAHYAYQLNLKLQNFQRAVQILLETESFINNANGGHDDGLRSIHNAADTFYVDALKACLIASLQTESAMAQLTGGDGAKRVLKSQSNGSVKVFDNGDDTAALSPSDKDISLGEDAVSGSSQGGGATGTGSGSNPTKEAVAPVIKLVATNLIANGHIGEGAELLNFISKTADSCRYLQSADQWLESIWLAKVLCLAVVILLHCNHVFIVADELGNQRVHRSNATLVRLFARIA